MIGLQQLDRYALMAEGPDPLPESLSTQLARALDAVGALTKEVRRYRTVLHRIVNESGEDVGKAVAFARGGLDGVE